MNRSFFLLLLLAASAQLPAQTNKSWNGKSCAVVLTYDDGLVIDIDAVWPALDSFGLKGTFYVIGSAPAVAGRLADWRRMAREGHELGNHTSFHPCDGQLPGRSFVQPDNDLSKYTLQRIVAETRLTNTLLESIDGKKERTFAFPCGDKTIGGVNYFDGMRKDFVAARGVSGGMPTIQSADLDNLNAYNINGQNAEYMIGLVQKAMQTHTLLVFLFHGVGGGHSLNVNRGEHTRLLAFLQQYQQEIWVATMVEVAGFIRNNR